MVRPVSGCVIDVHWFLFSRAISNTLHVGGLSSLIREQKPGPCLFANMEIRKANQKALGSENHQMWVFFFSENTSPGRQNSMQQGWCIFFLVIQNECALIRGRERDLTGFSANAVILNPFKIIFFILNLFFSVTRILNWFAQNPFEKRNNLLRARAHSKWK